MVFVAVVVVVVAAAIVTYIVNNCIQTASYYFVNVIPSIIGVVVISRALGLPLGCSLL